MAIYLKSDTTAIQIVDLDGFIVDSTSINITELFTLDDLVESDHLLSLVQNGDILVSIDGINWLTSYYGVRELSLETIHEDDIEEDPISHPLHIGTSEPDSTNDLWFQPEEEMFYKWDSTSNNWAATVIGNTGGTGGIGATGGSGTTGATGATGGTGQTGESGITLTGLSWTQSPNYNGQIQLLGWHIKTDENILLSSGTPMTTSEDGFHSHFVIDVSDSTTYVPFTIRVSGTSVSESDYSFELDSTENITITQDGFYQTSKSWIDKPQFEILESMKSCNLDIYKVTYWDRGNNNFTITGSRLEWEPDGATWHIRLRIHRVLNSGECVVIDDKLLSNLDFPETGGKDKYSKYKRGDYNTLISGVQNEGIIVCVDQQNIRTFFLEVKYSA